MAIAIEVLFAAAVLLAAGLAAAGRIDGMSRAVPDAPPGLPEGEVTPEGLRGATLPVVLRGYRMADVDDVLERAAAELEHARAAAGLAPSSGAQAHEPLPYEPLPFEEQLYEPLPHEEPLHEEPLHEEQPTPTKRPTPRKRATPTKRVTTEKQPIPKKQPAPEKQAAPRKRATPKKQPTPEGDVLDG